MEIVFPVLISGLAVFVIALLFAMIFCAFVLKAFSTMTKTLQWLNSAMAQLGNADMGNMKTLGTAMREKLSDRMLAAWERFESDTFNTYEASAVPNPSDYFNPEKAVPIMQARMFDKIMPYIFCFLGLCAFVAPLITSIIIDDTVPIEYLAVLGFSGAMFVGCLFALVKIPYSIKQEKYMNEGVTFIDLISAKTVVAKSSGTTSTVLRSNRETRDAFFNAANHITAHLSSMTESIIIPAVAEAYRESLDQANALTRQSMAQAENSFALLKTVEKTGMQFYAQLQNTAQRYEQFATTMTDRLFQLDETIAKHQSSILRVVEAIKADGINNIKTMQSLDNTMKHLYSGIGHLGNSLQQSVSETTAELSKAIDSNNKLAAGLAQAAHAQNEINAEQYKIAAESTKALISNMAGEMRSAMSVISTDIVNSIANAYKANAEIVDQLAARTQALVAEYDRYFSGIDQSTASVLNGMDSSISNTLIRLTDELSGVMDNFKESMHEGMERFESGTSKMIITFEEQSRDLGLYARELNIDVNALTENLRESVKIFNEGLNEGVQSTFGEFDAGLAQFTTRFANTLEAIRDSVEALPAALRNR